MALKDLPSSTLIKSQTQFKFAISSFRGEAEAEEEEEEKEEKEKEDEADEAGKQSYVRDPAPSPGTGAPESSRLRLGSCRTAPGSCRTGPGSSRARPGTGLTGPRSSEPSGLGREDDFAAAREVGVQHLSVSAEEPTLVTAVGLTDAGQTGRPSRPSWPGRAKPAKTASAGFNYEGEVDYA